MTIRRLFLAAAAIGAVVAFVAGMAYADDGPAPHGNGKLAFVRAGDIWVANADGSNSLKLTTHLATDRSPRWSPDGTEIAFSSNRDGDFEIFVMNADGSDQRQVTFNSGAQDRIPSWTADATQIVYDKNFSEIYVINADGSGGERKVADGFVPGTSTRGDKVVFSDGGLVVMHLDGGARRRITDGPDLAADWSPRGNELVFTRSSETDRDVYLMHANGSGLVRLTDTPDRFEFAPAWSPDGSKIAFVGCPAPGVAGDCQLYVLDREGGSAATEVVAAVTGGEGAVDWQPIRGREGSSGTIAFQSNRAGGPPELYTMAENGTNVRRLTFNAATDRMPRFSPGGESIVFASDRDGDLDVYLLHVASGAVTQVTNDPARDDMPVFSADGQTIVYQRGPFVCPCALRAVGVDGQNDRALETGPGNAANPDMSPRGRKLAFASDRTGTWAIYTMRLDGRQLRQVTHPSSGFGDFRPRWSPRGDELVFMGGEPAGNNDVFLVRTDGTQLRPLTSGPRFEEHANFSPDGRRVIFAVFPPEGGRLYVIGRDGTGEHALPQLAAPLSEGFDDGRIDAATWHTIVDPGSSLAETNGRLELGISADAVPGGQFNQVNTHTGSQCSLPGDYDMQVDFELLEWPAGGGVYASLNAFFANAGVSRWTNQWGDRFTAWSDGIGNSLPALGTRGSFRLVRTATTLKAYARAETGEWIQVLSGSAAPGNAVFGIGLTAVGEQFQHVAARVAFDNFRLISGGLACPSWWRDAGPDWAASLEEED